MKRKPTYATLEIKTSVGYAKYLKEHLATEHPKTKGKIKIK